MNPPDCSESLIDPVFHSSTCSRRRLDRVRFVDLRVRGVGSIATDRTICRILSRLTAVGVDKPDGDACWSEVSLRMGRTRPIGAGWREARKDRREGFGLEDGEGREDAWSLQDQEPREV